MKLLLIAPEYPPAFGGMQTHGKELARWFHRRGYPILVVTRKPRTEVFACEAEHYDQQSEIPTLRCLEDSNLRDQLFTLRHIADEYQPDVVYSTQIAFAPAFKNSAPVVCRTAGNDVIRPWVGPYDVSHQAMRRLLSFEKWHRLQANQDWIKLASKHCAAILCNSDWTYKKLNLMGLKNLHVIKGGVNVDLFTPFPEWIKRDMLCEDYPFTILIAARLVLKKGIDVALHAIAKLNHPRVRLMIIGCGPEASQLRSLSHELGIENRVSFVGAVSQEELALRMAWSQLLLMPSRSIFDPRKFTFDYETMGRSACEAAACGIPVIASHCGGLPEMVQNGLTGLLVRPGDAKQLALAIASLLHDPDRVIALGSAARQFAETELSFDHVFEQTLEIMRSVREEHGLVSDRQVLMEDLVHQS